MGIKRLFLVAIFTAVLTPISSQSEESRSDVQQLYRECTKPVEDFEKLFCVGFISGISAQMITNGQVAATLRAEGALANDVDRRMMFTVSACTKASVGARVQAFINWAEKHPEEWSTPRQLGVMQALRETWPCK
jgi:hypothetical protein